MTPFGASRSDDLDVLDRAFALWERVLDEAEEKLREMEEVEADADEAD